MSENKHTPEPWPVFSDIATTMTPDPEGTPVAILSWDDYIRARACVNACKGIPTELLERFKTIVGSMDEVSKIEKQRDELLADAARYRWLRDSENQLTEDDPCVSDSFFSSWFGEKLDKVIDEMIERNASVKSYGKPEKSAKTEVQSIVFFPAGSLGEEIEEEGRPA